MASYAELLLELQTQLLAFQTLDFVHKGLLQLRL